MAQPAGFKDPEHPDYVCKLDKAIYGLKQTPKAWFDKFSTFLLEYRFTCSKADPSLFVYQQNGNTLVLLLYVDDIILTCSKFSMKDLGSLHYFLGIQVETNSTGMFLSQENIQKTTFCIKLVCLSAILCRPPAFTT